MGFQVFVYSFWVLLLSIIGLVEAKAAVTDEECGMKRCSRHAPEIRFPFWLKDQHPEHCGYPGFQVSCYKGKTLLHVEDLAITSRQGIQFFHSREVPISKINYKFQVIFLDFSQSVDTLKLVLSTSSSSSIARPLGGTRSFTNVAFFSCTPRVVDYYRPLMLTSLSEQAFPVIYFQEPTYIGEPSVTLPSCTKLINTSLQTDFLYTGQDFMHWPTPDCRKCEAKGELCMPIMNSTSSNITTADNNITCLSRGRHQVSIKPIAGIIPGATLIVLVLIVLLYYIIRSYRQKKYDELKVEMFLANYKAMKPTRYSYADIKRITSHFSDKLGQGGYGSVYKGQITKEIIVAVKVLNSDPKANGEDFINEVGTIGRIYHVNVVRLLGYCADGCNRALIYEFQPNNSLEKFTYRSKNQHNNFLGWEKMQEIALGIAKGIEYLHQGCAQQILHFDIKPHNILLDQNFNPKISDFGLAKLCSRDQSIVSMTIARGTIGYIAPEVFSRNFGKVSSKSDVYSFGMLLLEMVGARDNNAVENNSETYFPEWIFHRLDEGGDVAIKIEKEEDSNVAKKLTIVGLWCIGWHPVERPSIKHVICMLESQECPPMPPNPFKSSNARKFANDLEAISESE